MAINSYFFQLDAATLAELKTDYVACLKAIATVGQSYSIGGRTFTRPDLQEVAKIVAEITQAQASQAGTRVTRSYTDFR